MHECQEEGKGPPSDVWLEFIVVPVTQLIDADIATIVYSGRCKIGRLTFFEC